MDAVRESSPTHVGQAEVEPAKLAYKCLVCGAALRRHPWLRMWWCVDPQCIEFDRKRIG